MHIGLIIYGSLDIISGGYLYDRQLMNYLEKAGHLVEVISLPWREYSLRMSDNRNGTVFERLIETDFDVLLEDELNHPSLYALNPRIKTFVNYPIISIVHHLHISEEHSPEDLNFYRKIEMAYLQSVDGFIFNSQSTKASVGALFEGVTRPHVVATPAGDRFNGLSEAEISDRAIQSRELKVVCLGNVIRRKGIHWILEAMSRVTSYRCRLDIIGNEYVEYEYTLELKKMVEDLDLTGRVRFHGLQSDEEIETHLSHSDLLVVPSQYEGFGIVYLEGMAFGLPAIATTSGGASEIITNRVDGFLIDPEDVDTLAERLALLAADRVHLKKMSLAARRRFEAYPTWEDSMASIETFLKSLV
ncbi:MAG: glycosyltransferase family 4 protein [Chloroflexota bacterium]